MLIEELTMCAQDLRCASPHISPCILSLCLYHGTLRAILFPYYGGENWSRKEVEMAYLAVDE